MAGRRCGEGRRPRWPENRDLCCTNLLLVEYFRFMVPTLLHADPGVDETRRQQSCDFFVILRLPPVSKRDLKVA